MIARSVPGYAQILGLLPTLAKQFRAPNHQYYDLGCSLGAGMLALAEGLKGDQCTITGIDNSAAMLHEARSMLDLYPAQNHVIFQLEQADVVAANLMPAAMVLLNFTLQFIAIERREDLVGKIYSSLRVGGALVLSEKIKFDDPLTNQALTELHHQYKTDQGYSQLEISQKRTALENVLIPETLYTHTERLKNAGFRVVTPWLQNLQFISILAIK